MNTDAVEDELLSPIGLRGKLLAHGLENMNMNTEEFELAQEYGGLYLRWSTCDPIALGIAKARGILLLTGDGALRKAVRNEKVEVMGTLGVLDELMNKNLIEKPEYEHCLKEMQKHNGKGIRLPKHDISIWLQHLMEWGMWDSSCLRTMNSNWATDRWTTRR